MACRSKNYCTEKMASGMVHTETCSESISKADKLFFGVDSKMPSNCLLQNNLTAFEWVVRNKKYPAYWMRNITNDNSLTREEINFLHDKGCKIGIIYDTNDCKETYEQGVCSARCAIERARELKIPKNTSIFMKIMDDEVATTDYLKGYAEELLITGYIPGFKANTDAAYSFDREFSRGIQVNPEIFKPCLIWAESPTLQEYDHITTTHLIHPDNWMPFAPSGTKRRHIAVWQYGKDCHPIEDVHDNEISFNIDLVLLEKVIIENMF